MPLRALAGAERSGFVRGTRAFAVAEARGTGGSVTRSRAMSAANVARDASAGSIPPAGVPSPLGKLDEQKTYSGRGGDLQDPPSGYFECNICLEVAQEPVVTQCGHLYCWPCIYKWLQVINEAQHCPVCKAGVSEDLVIPLYGRGTCGTVPAKQRAPGARGTPARPPGLRMPALGPGIGYYEPEERRSAGNFGLFSPLFGFGLQRLPASHAGADLMSPEQRQEVFLSRLLLLLGSFVILCLLIF